MQSPGTDVVLATGSSAVPVVAHAAGTLLDLPLGSPPWLLAAAAAVVLTGAALSRRDAADQSPPPRRSGPGSTAAAHAVDHPVMRGISGIVGLLGLLLVLALALVGPTGADRNALPRTVTVLLWGGLVPVSLLVGPFYRRVNPLRPLSAGLARALATPPRPLPEGIGRLPAAALAILVVATSQFGLDDLLLVRITVVVYVGAQALLGARYGPEWFRRADPFEVLSDVVGAVAIAGRRSDGRIGLRDPVVAPMQATALPATVAFVGVLVGASWFEAVEDTIDVDGLAVGVLGTAVAAAIGTGFLRSGAVRPFLVPATLPLAAAYGLQLYVVPLLLDGRIALSQLGDPLGLTDELPTLVASGVRLPVPTTAVAVALFVSFVALHVLSIVIAHRASLARFDLRGARAVQFPMRAVVLGSVVVGLWLPTLGA